MPDKFSKNTPKNVVWNTSGVSFDTQKLPDVENFRYQEAQDIILQVYEALEEKGYNPIYQLAGYILSGDPTYITSYKDARKIIGRVERDYLLEELVRFYLNELGRD